MHYNYDVIYVAKRFEEQIPLTCPLEENISQAFFNLSASLSNESHHLFKQSLALLWESFLAGSAEDKVLPLQGVLNLNTQQIHLAGLTPRNENALYVEDAYLIIEHGKKGAFEDEDGGRCYSPRMWSYQSQLTEGPTAHQQLLRHMLRKKELSADDAKNMVGISLHLRIVDKCICITIDGHSLSLNQTAQYLRTMHRPRHLLSIIETQDHMLKASGAFLENAHINFFPIIRQACDEALADIMSSCISFREPQI